MISHLLNLMEAVFEFQFRSSSIIE